MARGGARNLSGPPADPDSGRSDRRGIKLTALPSDGYDGEVPDWPLTPDATGTEESYWAAAWSTPQAWAWSQPSESWRVPSVARWVRLAVRCDELDAGAAHLAQLHRFADQIGMTPAGLRENGWAIATDEVGERRADREQATQPKRERRLRAAPDEPAG